MKAIRAGLCLAGAMLLTAAACSGQPDTEIRGALDEMRRALKENDAERLVRMYMPDARLTMANKVVEGQEAIRAYVAAILPVLGDFRNEDQEIVPGDGIAVETGRATFFDRAGAAIGSSRYMTVWKSAGGQWKVYRDIGVPIQAPRETPPTGFTVKQTAQGTAVVLPMTGSYEQHTAAIVRLVEYLQSAGVKLAGPPFGRYHNSPGAVPQDQLRWEVGMPVSGGSTAVAAPFQKHDYAAMTVAFTVVPGRDTARAWSELSSWAASQGYVASGPAMEVWLDATKTEIRLPVRKSGR
jgi:AraC family transcriptional regulator